MSYTVGVTHLFFCLLKKPPFNLETTTDGKFSNNKADEQDSRRVTLSDKYQTHTTYEQLIDVKGTRRSVSVNVLL